MYAIGWQLGVAMCSRSNGGYDIAVGVLGYEISGEPVGAGGSRWEPVGVGWNRVAWNRENRWECTGLSQNGFILAKTAIRCVLSLVY